MQNVRGDKRREVTSGTEHQLLDTSAYLWAPHTQRTHARCLQRLYSWSEARRQTSCAGA